MEQKYKGTIKDFPEEIVDRMLECQVEQGNPKDVSIFESNRHAGRKKGFAWKETKENHDFWKAIIYYKKFEKFYERYPKPTISKFEVGKWYTDKAWVPRSFCKATESKSGFSNRIYYSEFIRNGEHIVKSDWWCCDEHITLASLEEIQEYLPEGHPDKIKTISEFKKGDYIVTLKGEFKRTSCGKENYCFKARETLYYLKPVVDLAGNNSNGNNTIKFDKSDKGCTDWRYATPEEIAEYDRLGKPFDVTTLSKKEENLAGRYIKILKDRLSNSCTEAGQYYLISRSDKVEIVLDIPVSPFISKHDNKYYELMPEGWTPKTKETIVPEVPEYVECIKSYNKDFTVGEIYTWPRPIDNDGAKRNPGVLDGSVWTFKPSTKKEYDWQKQRGKLLLMDSIPHPDFDNFGTRKSASISDLSYNPCGEIPVVTKNYFIGIGSTIMQKPLTVKESYPTKETIKTQVISTNIINIPLKSKKKKQLFTI